MGRAGYTRAMPTATRTLIATLGRKPQVVTTSVDLLAVAGHRPHAVTVLHIAGDPVVQAAVDALAREFAVYVPYRDLPLTLTPIGGPWSLADADDGEHGDAEAAFRAVYQAVLTAKRAGQTVHLSVMGGRKILAVYAMAVAQLLFDDNDTLWYILAGGAFLAEGRLHPGPKDDARLVSVPVMRWSHIAPVLTDLSQVDDPFQAVERQRAQRLRQVIQAARDFVRTALTAGERRVVAVLVRQGASDQEIAARLSLSPRTVERHLGEAYAKAAVHWGLPSVSRTQLVALLHLYYASDLSEN